MAVPANNYFNKDTRRTSNVKVESGSYSGLAANGIINPGKTIRQVSTSPDWTKINNTKARTIDERYTQTAYQDNLLQPKGLTSQVKKTVQSEEVESFNQAQLVIQNAQASARFRAQLEANIKQKVQVSETKSKDSNKELRLKLTAINAFATPLVLKLHVLLIIPMSFVLIVGIGLAGLYESVAGSGGEGFFSKIINAAVSTVAGLLSLFGFDIQLMAYALIFMSYMIILAVGMCLIMSMYFVYLFTDAKPIFSEGKGAGLKIGMFLLAIIGLSIPLAQLIPFTVLWMWSVRFFPR